MRSRCCSCMCVCVSVYSPIVARQRFGKNTLIVARQRLGKNPPIVPRQRLGKNSPIIASNGSIKIPQSLLGYGWVKMLPR
jgi:hypothetical protein